MSKAKIDKVSEFLRESNAIEDVWDDQSLKQALEAWHYLIEWGELETAAILHAHRILMKDKLEGDKLGRWRKVPVWIGGREGKPWYVIPELMSQWIKIANHGARIKPIQDDVFINDHVAFESIHPFIDGNGRMGRMLMNWQRVRAGAPILVIKEAEKQEYYKWFK